MILGVLLMKSGGHVLDSFLASPLQGINIHGIAVYGDVLKNCKLQLPPDTMPQLVFTGMHTYPNPSNGSFTLQTNLSGKLTIQLFDKLGQPVYKKEFNVSTNNNKIPLNVGRLAAGIYVVQIVNGDKTVSKKIMIN